MNDTPEITPGKARQIAYCGLAVALMTVSAWTAVPLGPVPVTLQTFVVAFVLLALPTRTALASIVVYLLLGAVGLPVFSGFGAGIGKLVGPTGGFLWGFLAGGWVALGLRGVLEGDFKLRRGANARGVWGDVFVVVVFMLVTYLCGFVQIMLVLNLSPQAAFAAAVAPFVLIDAVKMALAIPAARLVRKHLPQARRTDG